MRIKYKLLMTLLVGAIIWPGSVLAQSELIVECQDENGEVIENALRDAIIQDENRPDDRVYVLQRSALCYNVDTINNSGFHLRIVGQTADELGENEEDFGPAVIQMREVDGFAARMFEIGNDLTLRNLWITGQGTGGSTTSYQPIQINGSNRDIVIDNVILERSNFHLIGVAGTDNRVTITNSVFRNFINTTQQWEGRGISFNAGAESLIMENNTFLNIGHTVVQSEARPIEYVRFVHNTMVNVGRTINSGGIWKEAYFANNLGVNVGWHGEDEGDFSETRETTHTGLFTVGELPPQFGTDLERAVVFANNAFWRDPAFETWYDENDYIAQPLFNAGLRDVAPEDAWTTQRFFDDLDNMLAENNLWQVDPGVITYTEAPDVDQFPETSIALEDLVPDMIQTMETLRAGSTTPNWNDAWLWDPGRDPTNYQAVNFVYPLPEELAYTNEQLQSHGTDDLPVGDLNWFPQAKQDWEQNRETYIEEIHGLVEPEEIEIVAGLQAEDAELGGDAAAAGVEGETWYTMAPGSAVEWTFDVPTEQLYALRFHVNINGEGAMRGVNMILNGEEIFDARGWDQFVFPPEDYTGSMTEFVELTYTVDDLADRSGNGFITPTEALTLEEGENTLRIQHSWADNLQVMGVDIIDPATDQTVVELRAPQATAEGATPSCGEGIEFCSEGFRHVDFSGGGTATFNVDLPATGTYLLRLFTDGAGTASILVDDEEVVPVVTMNAETGNVLTDRFTADAGTRRITVSSPSGGFSLDWLQVLQVSGSTSADRDQLPEGFALEQNYPNPFNPTTTIRYAIGKAGATRVVIYDVLGRQVRTLVDQDMPAGQHAVTWDGRSADGSAVASGVYFYRLETNEVQSTRSMVMLK